MQILLPDGSCIPATLANARKVLKQVRSAMLKARKAQRLEITAELQRNLEDRRAARGLLDELAAYDRDHRLRMAAVLRARVKPEASARDASPVRKRRAVLRSSVVTKPHPTSSWVVDDRGMRGVGYHQSYLSRKSPAFYRGAASDRWFYDARDEAVMRDADGNVIWFSNLGDDIDEVGAAWQAIEDATTRKNGKVQIRVIVPFDADASDAEKAEALRLFCETVLAPLGLPYSAVIHHAPEGGDERNDHGHVLTNLRPTERIAPYTWAFADEIRGELDGRNGVQMLRHLWAHAMSESAESSGSNRCYTGLSYAARGLNLDAGEHLGEARSAMVARGETVWAHERNRIRNARNAQRMIIRDLDRKIAALSTVRDALVADREAPVRASRRILVSAAARVERPAPRRVAGITAAVATRPPLMAAGGAMQGAPSRRHDRSIGIDRQPLRAAGDPGTATPEARQVLAVARTIQPDAYPAERRLIPAGASERAVDRRSPAAIGTRMSAPLVAVPPSTLPKRPTLVAAAQRAAGERRGALTGGDDDRRPAPLAVVETMRELLLRLARSRRTRAADPAIAALHRRRILADEEHRRRAGTIIPERLWLELNPRTAFTHPARDGARVRDRERLARIASGGGYVSARADGVLVQAISGTAEQSPEEQWWSQRHVQHALADLQRQQRELIKRSLADTAAELTRSVGSGPPMWRAGVDPSDRARLGRWAEAPAFRADVSAVARDLAGRNPGQVVAAAPLGRIADGFGAWRDTPPPTFTGTTSRVRLPAFERATGAPTDHLLRLLSLAGAHPRAIEVASDDRLMAVGKRPALLAPLLHGWRHDERVAALVIETVRMSREAGRAAWPLEVAATVRGFVANETALPGGDEAASGRPATKIRFDPSRSGGESIG